MSIKNTQFEFGKKIESIQRMFDQVISEHADATNKKIDEVTAEKILEIIRKAEAEVREAWKVQ